MGNNLCFVRSNSKGDFIDLGAMILAWVLIDSDFSASSVQVNAHYLVVGLQCSCLGLALKYLPIQVTLERTFLCFKVTPIMFRTRLQGIQSNASRFSDIK